MTAPLTRVDFTALTPDPLPFLGQAAYLQLEVFEQVARALATAPSVVAKEATSAAAAEALRIHHALVDEVRALGGDPVAIMAEFAADIDRFRVYTAGDDWAEQLLSAHLTSGMLNDYFERLAQGLPDGLCKRVQGLIGGSAVRRMEEAFAGQIVQAIAADPELADRLALWGRSLVADTLLVARSALRTSDRDERVGAEVEPVFTELISMHMRRMDALGLTA